MQVAVITDEQLPKTLSGFKLKVIPWDTEKLENENLRDYDGVVIDVGSYNKLGNIDAPDIIENEAIVPMITYDILNAPPSFYLVIGNPSQVIQEGDILNAVGFSGTYMKGGGTQHSMTEAASKSVYREYLSDIKRYQYSYDLSFSTASEIQTMVQFGTLTKYTTQHVPLMATKTGYLTAFRLQGEAYQLDSYGRILDRRSLFRYELPTFLPSHPEGFHKGLSILLRSIKERESVNNEHEPEWAASIIVHGQEQLDAELGLKDEQIHKLLQDKADLETRRAEARKVLEILYLGDKPLEGALKRTLQQCGYDVDEPNDNNNVEFYLKNGKEEFVVEVKSSLKSHFNKDGLRQVNEWRENEALDSGKEYKPVLILSSQYDKPLDERSTEDVLDENLITYAKSRKIAVITTPTLYQAIKYMQEGKITKAHLAGVIFKAEGLLKIEDFYSEEQA